MRHLKTDDLVIGAGILGLSTAWHLHRRGRTVRVLERTARIEGASVRNFGMIWPIGQEAGAPLQVALRSREHWLTMLRSVGLWHEAEGSVHALHHELEEAVAREFIAQAEDARRVQWLSPKEACRRAPRLRCEGLRGALFSATEVCVDPRRVLTGLQAWLEGQGIAFHWETAALEVSAGCVRTGRGAFEASEVWVCTGHDLSGPFAELLQASGIVPFQPRMLRTVALPNGERVGPMLAAGLTLAYRRFFAAGSTLSLLRASLQARHPGYPEHGIHVMVSQTSDGALTLGDSHVYGKAIDPFLSEEVGAMILAYLDRFFDRSDLPLASRWIGVYGNHLQKSWVVLHPDISTHVVTGVGGAGMTLSFGLTETVVCEVLGGS
jgi:FAD dependent oxidoreductase TIGR03364